MSKDITDDILLKAGFHPEEDGSYLISPKDYVYISLNKNRKKKWFLMVTLHCFPQLTIIRNIKQLL